MDYTIEQIEKIAEKMKAVPPLEKSKRLVNKKEAVSMLKKDIMQLQKRGYTLEQIAQIISKEGLALSVATLRGSLQRIKSEKTVSKPKTNAPPSPTTQKKMTSFVTEDTAQI